ncbi:hypothetical protein E4U57_006536 [Claviceps arundinis]|uniref:Uncharacterized protein n=1 Tax=Claviceps arundinis TaxID=1623583 RepID=A0ABQ7PGI3_9HYPO|nr:hypothetical protein E4U57_006536 [Claviceps arundinis]
MLATGSSGSTSAGAAPHHPSLPSDSTLDIGCTRRKTRVQSHLPLSKKDYGKPTRKSERFGAHTLERSIKNEEVEEAGLSRRGPPDITHEPEPVEPAAPVDTEPEEPVVSIESD